MARLVLSANIKNKKFGPTFIIRLDTSGVPKKLKGTVYPFLFNNIDELTRIVKKNDIELSKWKFIEINPRKEIFRSFKVFKRKT